MILRLGNLFGHNVLKDAIDFRFRQKGGQEFSEEICFLLFLPSKIRARRLMKLNSGIDLLQGER